VFAGHLYARSAAGTTASVEKVGTADARAAYTRHFVRKNVVLGFAGDITPDEAQGVARALTKGLPSGETLPDPATSPTLPLGRRLVFVDKPERTQTQILIGSLGTWPHDPDHIAIGVACAIFGGTFTSRLMREVRSKRGWSYGASARLAVDRQRQAFSMWTFPAATDAAACIKLELDLLETLVTTGVTARETTFIRRYLMRSHAFDIDTAPKRLAQAMDVELLGLPADYYTGYVDAVSKITEVEANAAIKARLSTENLRVVVVGTASSLLDGVRAAIPGLAGEAVVPFDKE
jgi:zinc protease